MKTAENVINLGSVDPIEVEFGYALIPLVDEGQGGDLLDRIVMIRRQIAIELGIVVPVVRIRDNIQLEPNEYRLKIKGNEVATGELLLDHYLAMTPDLEEDRKSTRLNSSHVAISYAVFCLKKKKKKKKIQEHTQRTQ